MDLASPRAAAREKHSTKTISPQIPTMKTTLFALFGLGITAILSACGSGRQANYQAPSSHQDSGGYSTGATYSAPICTSAG